MQENEITTPARLAHFLAQILHETGGLRLDWENMNYSARRLLEVFGQGRHSAAVTPDEAERLAFKPPAIAERVYGFGNPVKAQALGNKQPGDGYLYRGGGLMQTTGRDNYRRMGEKCGVAFEDNPELILSPKHALKPALAEWSQGDLNLLADQDDILSISRAINLGNAKSNRTPNGLEDRVAWLAKLRPLIATVDFKQHETSPQPHPEPAPKPSAMVTELAAPSVRIINLIGGRLLRQGDEGEKVRALQLALAKLGYNLRGTGYFGGATDTAITDFQRINGLEVDGVVGPETANALDRLLANHAASGNRSNGSSSNGERPGANRPPAHDDSTRPLWLLEGLKWINTEEEEGASDNPEILDWARAEGGAIAKDYQHDSIPWCALFANMILTKVGLKGTETLWALDWAKWGVRLDGPAVGAFAPMKRDGGGHIAVVVGRDQHGNLMCLGGNQSDAVNIKPFPVERPLSFRWPQSASPPASVGLPVLPLVRSDGRVSAKEG